MKPYSWFLLVSSVFLFSCGQKKSGEKYSRNDSTKNSVERLTELIEQNPKDAEPIFYRASLYLRNGNSSDALNDMLSAVAIDSTKPESSLQLGDIYFTKLFI